MGKKTSYKFARCPACAHAVRTLASKDLEDYFVGHRVDYLLFIHTVVDELGCEPPPARQRKRTQADQKCSSTSSQAHALSHTLLGCAPSRTLRLPNAVDQPKFVPARLLRKKKVNVTPSISVLGVPRNPCSSPVGKNDLIAGAIHRHPYTHIPR